jgi:hypothetical protein
VHHVIDTAQVLSRLIDGEPVDVASARAALQDPDAIDTILSFIELRHGLQAAGGDPGRQFYERWRGRVATPPRWPAVRRAGMIAATLVLGIAAGLAVGAAVWRPSGGPLPPTPSQVIDLTAETHWQPVNGSESRQP